MVSPVEGSVSVQPRVHIYYGGVNARDRSVLIGVARYYQETAPHWDLRLFREHDRDRLREALSGREADVVALRAPPPDTAEMLDQARVPVLMLNASHSPHPRVYVDQASVGRLAAQRFHDQGFTHVSVVRDHRPHSVQRHAAFVAQAEAFGMCVVEGLHTHPIEGETHDGIPDAEIHAWAHALPKPTGVFCAYDYWGQRLIRVCNRTGLRVPQDLAVIGVDNEELICLFCRPMLSSVEIPTFRLGRRVAEMLDALLTGETLHDEQVGVRATRIALRPSSDLFAYADPVIQEAVVTMRERLAEGIDIGGLAEVMGHKRRALEHRFRRALGMSPWKMLRHLQLDRACRLLCETTQPLDAIAAESGIGTASRLCTVFRQELETTPTEYRREHRPLP